MADNSPAWLSLAEASPCPFSLATYNALSQALCTSSYLPHASRAVLRAKWRRPALIAGIAALGADVLCLQELDSYADHWRAALESAGYSEGAWKKKPSLTVQRQGKLS
eukprot:m51a1_g13189 hypothetical protein (108) ;mRNA; r:56-525